MTLFILSITSLVLYSFITERGPDPIRTEHLQQHADDHEKYDRMIELLEETKEEKSD